MCGACGTSAPRHWSAPFLASHAARATAARAITSLIGPVPAVVAAPAGFLIRRPTGATTIASHLGEVWQALDRLDVPRPADASYPAHVTGPVTLPPDRASLLEVHLVLCDETTTPPPAAGAGVGRAAEPEHPAANRCVDGRDCDPHDLIRRLHSLAVSRAGGASPARLVLGSADLPRTLPHLEADPTRPYQLRLEPISTSRDSPEPGLQSAHQLASASNIPALLAWAGARRDLPERLAVRLPVGDDRTFELEMLRGIVTRATVGSPVR